MSTHCVIAQVRGSKVKAITCHFDGYYSRTIEGHVIPSGVGAVLLEQYNTKEKVTELVNGGNLNSLVGKHTPSDDTQPKNFNSFESFFRWASKGSGCGHYIYVFNTEWTVYKEDYCITKTKYAEKYTFGILTDIVSKIKESYNDNTKVV